MTTTYLPDVAITTIRPHGANPRRNVGDVAELAASIAAHGLLEPLVVAPMNGSEYRLIAGHRRLAAAKHAGLTTVPALLREDLDTPPTQLEAMLVENTQRVDLTPAEEAAAYKQLVAFPGYTATKAAKATGRSVKTVKSRLAIAELPEATLAKVHAGTMTLGDAEVLVEFAGTDDYDALVRAAGTANFAFTVTRARENRHRTEALALVRAWCAEHGYEETTERGRGATVFTSYSLPKNVTKVLVGLASETGYVLWSGRGAWSLLELTDETDEDDDTDDSEPDVTFAAAVATREAADAKKADRNTAREVRRQWLAGRVGSLIVKDAERADLLRILLLDYLEYGEVTEADEALSGIPPMGDRNTITDEQREWIAAANENRLWKALLVLTFGLATCGSEQWPHDHWQSIRVAQALGYEPSDVEVELLGGAT